MLALKYCQFVGLQGFEKLELLDLEGLTTLVGPNGSGKSTVLRVLRLAFDILQRATICDVNPPHENWDHFDTATLYFEGGSRAFPSSIDPQLLEHYLGESFDSIKVEIMCGDTEFCISRIDLNLKELRFSKEQKTKTSLIKDAERIDQLKKELTQTESQREQFRVSGNSGAYHNLSTTCDELAKKISAAEQVLKEARFVPIDDDSGVEGFWREEVDELLSFFKFPKAIYLDDGSRTEHVVPKLLSDIRNGMNGRSHLKQKVESKRAALERLLQSTVDVSEDDKGHPQMHIDGKRHHHASSGTQISLYFFALTEVIDDDCIILWDEPENGLHTTRRVRLLDLMTVDKRQFILATHAPEFAPILSKEGKVFRCQAGYDRDNDAVKIGVKHVAERRDAFLTLDALGIHPAQTLFTANVVVWVEGPTELLFYRHWLAPRLNRSRLFEGVHYTLMQYGGSLISYLDVADEAHLESAFDLLGMCRHPLILVDSDFKRDPTPVPPSEALKPGAARLKKEIDKLNEGRPDAGMFGWTTGREIENYLPEDALWYAVEQTWKDFTVHKEALQREQLVVGQFDSCDESLLAHFVRANVVDIDELSDKKPKGRSRWGSSNKVERMSSALKMPGLVEEMLKWECSEKLKEIEQFIVRKCTQ